APAQPRTIASGIEYIQPPQPEYPPISRRMGEEGKAVLRVLVNDKGHPERVELQKSSGIARLDEAARKAVLRALFKPFIEDGKAVPAYAIVPINFQLD
ncbi:MAG: energy transducer TonB, partial [Bacillota bacterium]